MTSASVLPFPPWSSLSYNGMVVAPMGRSRLPSVVLGPPAVLILVGGIPTCQWSIHLLASCQLTCVRGGVRFL